MTILGIMGEAARMDYEESMAFVRAVLKAVRGRVPIVVGVTSAGTDNLVKLSYAVMDAGAAAVMINPLFNTRTDGAIYNYYGAVFERLGPKVPVVVQDVPWVSNSWTTVATVDRMVRDYPQFVVFKHEEDPGLRKLSAVRKLGAKCGSRRVSILAGVGGVYLPQELGRGADGAMTGFGFPQMLCDVCDLYEKGEIEHAKDIHDAFLPYARYELQNGPGIAIREHVLWMQGALRTPHVRHPRPTLDALDHREIADLIRRLKLRLKEIGGTLSPSNVRLARAAE